MTIDSKIKNKNPSTKLKTNEANENEIDTGPNLSSLLIDADKTKKLKNALIRSNSSNRNNHGPKFSSKHGDETRYKKQPPEFTETFHKFNSESNNYETKTRPQSIVTFDSILTQSSSDIKLSDKNSNAQLIKKFKRAVYITMFCFRWSNWAILKYSRTMHRYISFAQMTAHQDATAQAYHDMFRINKPNVDMDIINTARLKAEMMNFDKSYFKPTKRLNVKLPKDVKTILSKQLRTDDELEHLRLSFKGMSHLKSINTLPDLVRDQFFKCCWLEEYESERIVVNQGHKAELFYLVVSGSLVGTHKPENDRKSYTICFLEKGMTFGELALLSESTHSAAITTRSEVELLVVTKKDFYEIFVNQVASNDPVAIVKTKFKRFKSAKREKTPRPRPWSRKPELPPPEPKETYQNSPSIQQNIDFLTELPFLKKYPIAKIFQEKSKYIKTCIYPNKKIISSDTNASKFIYIVKSGAMSVMVKVSEREKIKGNTFGTDVIAKSSWSNRSTDDTNNDGYFVKQPFMEDLHTEILHEGEKLKEKSESERLEELETKMKYNQLMKFLNDTKNVEAESAREVNDGQLTAQEHLKMLNERNQFIKNSNGTLNYEYVANRIKEMDETFKKLKKSRIHLPKITKSPVKTKPKKKTSFHLPHLEASLNTKEPGDYLNSLKRNRFAINNNRNEWSEDASLNDEKHNFNFPVIANKNLNGQTQSLISILSNGSKSKIKSEKEFESASTDFDSSINNSSMLMTISSKTEYKPMESLLLIQKLEAGAHFGTQDILFDSQPPMNLVSNGCELILIPKDLFVEYSSVDYLKYLRKMEAPLPKYEEIQYQYESHLNWKQFTRNNLLLSLEKHSNRV